VAYVVGELKRHLRDTSWRLQVPRPRKDQAPLIPRPSRQPHCTVRLAVDARRSRFPCLLNYACAYYILHTS